MSVLQIQNVSKSFGICVLLMMSAFHWTRGIIWPLSASPVAERPHLAKMIMGLIKPDEGFIKAEAYSLQMVFQDPHQSLDPLWNVREILKEALWRKRSLSAKANSRRKWSKCLWL